MSRDMHRCDVFQCQIRIASEESPDRSSVRRSGVFVPDVADEEFHETVAHFLTEELDCR